MNVGASCSVTKPVEPSLHDLCRGVDPTLLLGPVEGLLSHSILFIGVIFASVVVGDGVYIHQLTY